MVLPLLKLGTLAIRTLSKPIAGRLKTAAGFHPRFLQSIINMAQANHRLTTTMQRRIYGHATNVEIQPLNEEKAVQDAVDLIGELFVFSVQRSSRSEARKEELRKKEIEELRQRDDELAKAVELLRHKLEELEHQPKGPGLAGVFKSRQAHSEDGKSGKPW